MPNVYKGNDFDQWGSGYGHNPSAGTQGAKDRGENYWVDGRGQNALGSIHYQNPIAEDEYVLGGPERYNWAQAINDQRGQAQDYLDRVRGGQGVGSLMMGQGIGQAQQAMMSQAAQNGNNPLAQRAAIYGGGQMAAQSVGDSAVLGAQQEMQAQAALQSVYGQRTASEMQWEAMDQQRQMAQAAHHAQMLGMESETDWGSIIGAVGMGAAALAASDERLKTGIVAADSTEEDEALEKLKTGRYAYDYAERAKRELKQPNGRQYGIMAQDLESSPLLKSAVIDTPKGKLIDGGRAATHALALIGRVAERLDKVEQKGKAA